VNFQLIPTILRDNIFVRNSTQSINRRGTSTLLVEQNADIALGVANHGHVLETGEDTLSRETKQLLSEEKVNQLTLG
jgi:branched-chain amino acid transport system ATP-binding protein